MPTDEVLELAALYALGALSAEEAATFEAHLAEGCPTCENEANAFATILGHLGYGVLPVTPRAEVRSRLLNRVRAEAGGAMRPGPSETEAGLDRSDLTIVHSAEGQWEAGGAPGLVVKRLFLDHAGQRLTALGRMKAGSRYPSHRHADFEELYVLEGDLTVEGQVLRAGDYCAALGGTVHRDTYSDRGCMFFVLASGRDEILEEAGTGTAASGLVFVRSAEGAWREAAAAGMAIRPIFSDPVRGTTTAMVRMRAAASLPRRRHMTAEQVYMLEGAAIIAGQVLKAGDYYRAAAGTLHPFESTEGGCMFLMVSSGVEALV